MSNNTFGFELEWSNVNKKAKIPEKLGYWEGKGNHSEVDLINFIDETFVVAWPNGQWGGEINTRPTSSVADQVNVIADIYNHLTITAIDEIVVTPISNGHVHIRNSQFDDLQVLKKLYKYTIANQEAVIRYWLSLDELALLKKSPGYHKNGGLYMRMDGGKKISENFLAPVEAAQTIDEFYRAMVPHAKESGNILWARAGRGGINLHSLRHTGTVEFRCMKASVSMVEIEGQLQFAEEFVNRAIDGGPNFTLAELEQYQKPPIDPHDWFQTTAWLAAQNEWWDTREERKKTGVKTRIGRLEVDIDSIQDSSNI